MPTLRPVANDSPLSTKQLRRSAASRVDALLSEIRACRVCEAHLPLGPRPIVRIAPSARILMVGQAPGLKVHESGIPWNDASGKRLREWLGVEESVFYDPRRFAIVPMSLCYPGRGHSGDLPPRPECAPLWHERILSSLPHIRLTILIGQYALAKYLGERRQTTLTETVAAWKSYAPQFITLPHPSPRNQNWLKQNPWFDREIVPMLRKQVANALA